MTTNGSAIPGRYSSPVIFRTLLNGNTQLPGYFILEVVHGFMDALYYMLLVPASSSHILVSLLF
jgi:hypothetical protein